MRVEQFLEASAGRFPDKTAVVAGGQRVSYRELNRDADRLAAALVRRGVAPGDRVVLFMDNSVETLIALFAVLKAGGVFSIINPSTKKDRLAFVLNNSGATALITQGRLMPIAGPAARMAPSVAIGLVAEASGDGCGLDLPFTGCFDAALGERAALPAPARGSEADLAALIYTSGSTGAPKGVMLTHDNMVTAVTSITEYLENTSQDVLLDVLPLAFGYGLNQVLSSCRVGATVVLEKSFAYPYATLQKMKDERVTGFALVPTIAALLLQMKDLTPESLPHLRYITNAAAALPVSHARRLQQLFPETRIFLMHGLTECTRTLYLPPDQVRIRPDSVGKAIPHTEAHIVNDRNEPAGPEEVGELVIRGGHVMKGYWGDPEATGRALRPDPVSGEKVLYTGDLFRMDADGYFYFVSRKDDIIKSRGEKVSPKDVENVLYSLQGVSEAAVVGVPDAILGEAVMAVVVPAEGACLSERQILRHCAHYLEDFMVPKAIRFSTELPKTDSGKIRRAAVRAQSVELLQATVVSA